MKLIWSVVKRNGKKSFYRSGRRFTQAGFQADVAIKTFLPKIPILLIYWFRNLFQVKESFGDEDSSTWRIHWDHQLYKVLELHYASGLSSLVDRLPDIQLDLVIRGDQISFRPELENARARFYKEVKRFSQIPYSFRGVSDEKDFFIEIGYSNRIV